jgi:hypothetical protein
VNPKFLQLGVILPKSEAACKQCVVGGTKFVMEHAISVLKEKCAKAASKSCKFSKICKFMGKHPKVALGMVFQHVRPMSLVTAYCTGKGSCAKPDEVSMDEILSGEQPHEALLEDFDKIDWSGVVDEAKDMVLPEQKEDSMTQWEEPQCEEKSDMKVCPHCLKKAMRATMKFTFMKVKAMCMKNDSPKMRRMCPWMAQHKAEALGMLIAKVEPWKFAMGWCMHKKHQKAKWGVLGSRGDHHGEEHGHGGLWYKLTVFFQKLAGFFHHHDGGSEATPLQKTDGEHHHWHHHHDDGEHGHWHHHHHDGEHDYWHHHHHDGEHDHWHHHLHDHEQEPELMAV